MRAPHRHGYHAKDSVLIRTLEGRIDSWNRSAEDLYGWAKEYAVGRVSHDLLQTRFPKPLKEIESELIEKGSWEGQLVHVTRDGGRVVVESRWILDRSGERDKVVEINAPSAEGDIDAPVSTDSPSVKNGRQDRLSVGKSSKVDPGAPKLTGIIRAVAVCFCILGTGLFALFGHDILRLIYEGKVFGIDTWVMRARAITPLEDYYAAADAMLVTWVSLLVLVLPIVVLFLKNPLGACLAGFSVFAFSFLLFCLLEVFPSLIVPLRMDRLSTYYLYKVYYIPDPILGWRGKPHTHLRTADFEDAEYSPVELVGAPPQRINWRNDQNGFRNSMLESSYDVVVTGDSFMAFGDSEADTFPKRMEKHLGRLTVLNLGIGGYGPFQYLEALKAYGLSRHPKYALFAFYSGNDLHDVRSYVRWKSGQPEGMYSYSERSFFDGYRTVLYDVLTGLNSLTRALTTLALERIKVTGGYPYTQPDIAVLDLGGNRRHRIGFVDLIETEAVEEITRTDEWDRLGKILSSFKDVCERNGIKPIAVYIPSATQIYAKYSTDESGTQWRHKRNQQIAAQKNLETAFVHVSREVQIDLINLAPVFERAAEKGQMLFYPNDSHWNAEGREVAARYVAEQLKAKR